MNMLISEELKDKLKCEGILIEQVQQMIINAEISDQKVINAKTGSFTTHMRIGTLTLWVEYLSQESDFVIKSVYYHRINIEEEMKNEKK